MNGNKLQRLGQSLLLLLGCVFVFQSCEKKRTVLSTRSTGYKISGQEGNELEGGKSSNKALSRHSAKNRNQKLVVNKKGEVIDTRDRGDLYADRDSLRVRESGSSFRGQNSKYGNNSKYKSKSFKTPEYLKQDQFASQSYREGTQQARISEKSITHRLFKTQTARDATKAAREGGESYRDTGLYSTSANRSATKAQEGAATAAGVKSQNGYQKSALTVDDVRKLVHPESIR